MTRLKGEMRSRGHRSDEIVKRGIRFNDYFLKYRFQAVKPYFKGKTCLELGSAEGRMTAKLIDHFERIVAVEPDSKRFKKIRSSNKITKLQSSIEKLELRETFNTVLIEHVLEHVEQPIVTLRKVKKWLKPNGVAIIGVPNADSLHRYIGVELGMLRSKTDFNERDKLEGHRRVYTVKKLQRHLDQAGLRVKKRFGLLLKFVSFAQMQQWFSDDMVEAALRVGKKFPDYCSNIYVICQKS